MFQFVLQAGHEVVGEEFGERVGQAGVGDALDVAVDAFEDRLVHLPLRLVLGPCVGRTEVLSESQRRLQIADDGFPVDLGRGERCAGVGQLLLDAGLFFLEEVELDRTRGVGLKQLAAFTLEVGDALTLLPRSLFGSAGVALHSYHELVVQCPNGVVAEFDGRVVVGDLVFDYLYRDSGQVAVVALLVSSETQEVVVLAATPAGAGEDQSGLATCAEDSAAEVVIVLALLLWAVAMAGERGLHVSEDVDVDQWLVLSGLLDSAPGDDADVEEVPEHVMDAVHRYRLARPLGRGPSGQSLGFELLGDLDECVVAARVGLESPLHEWCPFAVDGDGADLVAVAQVTDVQVADRSLARMMALLGFLVHTLDDLCCQVPRIELGDRAHDAVQQHARGRLVDVLRDRHQLRARFADREIDCDIVGAVAGQPVDLVDNDVVDVAITCKAFQHGVQLRPVGAASALAGVDVLVKHERVELFRFARTCVTLGRNGEAFCVTIGLDLTGCRHAQVDDGAFHAGEVFDGGTGFVGSGDGLWCAGHAASPPRIDGSSARK